MNTQWDCTGTVDFFNETGGYGLITTDAVDEDVFFHLVDYPAISTIQEGDSVRFNYEQAGKGPQTTEMEIISSTPGMQTQSSGQSTERSDAFNTILGPETGSITFYNDTGEYGFISSNQVDEDVFFSLHDVGIPDAEEGDRVRFSYRHVEQGPRVTTMEHTETHPSPETTSGTTQETAQSQRQGEQLPGEISFYNDTALLNPQKATG